MQPVWELYEGKRIEIPVSLSVWGLYGGRNIEIPISHKASRGHHPTLKIMKYKPSGDSVIINNKTDPGRMTVFEAERGKFDKFDVK